MAGSHEVRGSNPLFSTMNSIAGRTIGQRFFYVQIEGSESRLRAFLSGIPRFSCHVRKTGVAGCAQDAHCEGNLVFSIAFLLVCSCRVAISLSCSPQLRVLRDVSFDRFPVGFPVARWRGVSAGDNPDGHGLVHVQRRDIGKKVCLGLFAGMGPRIARVKLAPHHRVAPSRHGLVP